MKIGFDAKRAVQNKTGLGNYSRFVIEGLSRFYPNNKYLLYVPKLRQNHLLGSIAQQPNCKSVLPESFIWRKLSSLCRISGFKAQLKTDEPALFHGLSNTLPIGIERLKKTKTVFNIHDLILYHYSHV